MMITQGILSETLERIVLKYITCYFRKGNQINDDELKATEEKSHITKQLKTKHKMIWDNSKLLSDYNNTRICGWVDQNYTRSGWSYQS